MSELVKQNFKNLLVKALVNSLRGVYSLFFYLWMTSREISCVNAILISCTYHSGSN